MRRANSRDAGDGDGVAEADGCGVGVIRAPTEAAAAEKNALRDAMAELSAGYNLIP
jgi:hypothetical protein